MLYMLNLDLRQINFVLASKVKMLKDVIVQFEFVFCYNCLYYCQGSHFLENQGMSGNSVLTGMSGNFAVCPGNYTFANETLLICICNLQ